MSFQIPRKATQYIFFEMLPSFLMGLTVFIFILLMAQALRYTEFVLIHGVGVGVIGQIIGYLSISFLPALLPMSLLFSVLMTYGRLSNDSEMVALKATGMSMGAITVPALMLSVLVTLFSAHTSFNLGPWGNRQFEVLINKIGQTKAAVTIREGTFSEGFFDKVVYANQVDSKTGQLKDVFIYDEGQGDVPLTIIAKTGLLVQDPSAPNTVLIRLFDGDVHRKSESHTKIKFDTYDIRMTESVKEKDREKSLPSLTLDEISNALTTKISPEEALTLRAEYHKRWAISAVCLIFGLLGVGLGTNTHRRNQKGGGMILSLVVVVSYWILYVTCEGLARSGQVPAALAIWTPNIIFAVFAYWTLKKNWN
ncbi:MAG: LPS export ABC transporter permease LptF [Bdellovibrio sp. CG10_big_fil_rev_8_21_14_0_10_47_8]|nr:MAG: LPS export ABC transporter permease LptF [Bdellovibrio sp. CG10_big_fil_rev_8_21_14_0_10_47_8]